MIRLIAASTLNRVIGKQEKLPWPKVCADWSYFLTTTRDDVLIVGRKSFEEFDHAIPGRTTIVVSPSRWTNTLSCGNGHGAITTTPLQKNALFWARSLEEALAMAKGQNIWIGGGRRLFEEGMSVAQELYLTRMHATILNGDVYFPPWESQFPRLTSSRTIVMGPHDPVPSLSFEIWSRAEA